jgi:hypothetical protein
MNHPTFPKDWRKTMDKTIEETIETVDKMLAIPKVQMYWAAQREYEREKEFDGVRELFNERYDRIIEITKIKDNIFIVECEDKSFAAEYFMPIVNNKNLHESFPDFNHALLAAVSIEQTGKAEAGYWAAKLMVKEERK